MDIAVKERLIGAAVLVVLVVLVVPALLRGPRPPAEPAPPAAGDTRVVEINLAGSSGLEEAQPALPEPAVAADVLPAAGAPENAANPMTDDASPAGPGEAGPDGPVPQEPAPAERLAATAPDVAVAPPAAAGWAVQLAALSKPEAAATMVSELRQKGYPAFVLEHRADGRVLYRVRVGPEAQRERAEALARRLRDDGFKPAVVEQP